MANRVRDDRNRDLVFVRPPTRIVSLVPSDTLTFYDLGLGDRLVGRTRYCIEPAGRVDELPICGGTKDPDIDAIAELAPDLILANQEENSRAPLQKMIARGLPVYISFPRRVADGIAHMAKLARILGVEAEPTVRELVRRGYELLKPSDKPAARPVRVFLPIWMDPLMTLGADTTGSDMLSLIGAENVFSDRKRRYPLAADVGESAPTPDSELGDRDTRYPRVTLAEVEERAPEIVLLPDEPHEFTEADADLFRKLSIQPKVVFCDGKDLFWHGSRSIDAVPRLRALIDSLR